MPPCAACTKLNGQPAITAPHDDLRFLDHYDVTSGTHERYAFMHKLVFAAAGFTFLAIATATDRTLLACVGMAFFLGAFAAFLPGIRWSGPMLLPPVYSLLCFVAGLRRSSASIYSAMWRALRSFRT